MQPRNIVSQDDWFQAHKAHLAREKAFTRERDRLAEERRKLPWMKVEKEYLFDTTDGRKTLSDLFKGRSQLLVYHFMFGPGADYRCKGCSFLCDHIDGAEQHLRNHDISLVAASRAPLAELLPYKERMGWKFDWVSSGPSDFNFDFQVSFSEEQVASGFVVYNFQDFETGPDFISRDWPGITAFYKSEDGAIYCTFMARARGGDILIGAYNWLDMAPLGRNETQPNTMNWVRLHDEYEERPTVAGDCCHD
jgi:predicted dithiol-disulfide oxidoreductase (DUF899 family)